MQGGVAGLKRKASQMSGASLGSAISRGSAASAASADSKVIHLTPSRGFSHSLRPHRLDPVLMNQSDQSAW